MNEVVDAANVQPMDSTQSPDSGDSDYADMNEDLPFVVMDTKHLTNIKEKYLPSKRFPMRMTRYG